MAKAQAQSEVENETATCQLAGQEVVFDGSGALFIPAEQLLVFSDLHFEKGTSLGARGVFLPPYDTRATLRVMAEVIDRYQPQTVLSLGDAFHDGEAEHRMAGEDADVLEKMTRKADWIWLLGNHDPQPPERFASKSVEQITLAGLTFTHEPTASGAWHVAGHLHPAAKVRAEHRSMRRRCFVHDGERLVMPSFGAYTGGLNILDTAYHGLFSDTLSVHVLHDARVWQVPAAALQPDPPS